MNDKEKNIVNSIRILGMDMINSANSGHPGIVLGAAPIMYTLFARHMRFVTNAPDWLNRDRFVMSAGHGSALLYSTLFMAGFNLSMDDLRRFRQIDSITPGHPECGITPGVDMSTGPLGQGIANAVGIAMGERYLRTLGKEYLENQKIVDFNTYVLVGDGDLMEGISYEACSLAGAQKLGRLIVLYDSNDTSLDGETNLTFNENVLKRFEAMGWHTQLVKNGENIRDIDKAIHRAKIVTDKPSIIEIKTVIGKGSINEGKNIVHGKPIAPRDMELLRKNSGIIGGAFEVSKDATVNMRSEISSRMSKSYGTWSEEYNKLSASNNDKMKDLAKLISSRKLNVDFSADKFSVTGDYREELRESNAKVLNLIADRTPYLIGGSADLSSSTMASIRSSQEMSYKNPIARNIYFGVREHAMNAIANGLATLGLKTFTSGFLSFSNYSLPAIRMSALMNLGVTNIFTHDSIAIGEDGPTHQPVEQLSQLRLIPNMTVIRPADINEIIGAWSFIMSNDKPVSLIIAKADGTLLKGSDANQVFNGGYILKKETGVLNGVIIATGVELKYALLISDYLDTLGIHTRVVSIPSLELFIQKGSKYEEEILGTNTKRVVIEFSRTDVWHRYISESKYIIGVNDFGYSGKKEAVLRKYELDFETLRARVEELFVN